MIRTMLIMYLIVVFLFVLIRQQEFVLPLLLAVSMTFTAKLAAQAFHTFAPSSTFKQIVYLVFISAGIQYLLQFMQLDKEAMQRGFEHFETLNFIPLIASIAAFYRHIMLAGIPPTLPVIKEIVVPKIKTVKKEKIAYYEILNEVVPQYPIFTGV